MDSLSDQEVAPCHGTFLALYARAHTPSRPRLLACAVAARTRAISFITSASANSGYSPRKAWTSACATTTHIELCVACTDAERVPPSSDNSPKNSPGVMTL